MCANIRKRIKIQDQLVLTVVNGSFTVSLENRFWFNVIKMCLIQICYFLDFVVDLLKKKWPPSYVSI